MVSNSSTLQRTFEKRFEKMKSFVDSICPLFGICPLISCFLLNTLVYCGTMALCKELYHYDLTTSFDMNVPFAPGWVFIYLGCYIFWIANYILAARINRDDKPSFYRFVTADMMSRLVCAVFFVALPTTNIRPEITGSDLGSQILGMVYSIDQPTNLFPSIHCLVSWFCFIAIRGSDKVSSHYKVFSCLFALLVCASTQFTKQHYIADVFGALLIAELLFFLNRKRDFYKPVQAVFEHLNRWLQLSR